MIDFDNESPKKRLSQSHLSKQARANLMLTASAIGDLCLSIEKLFEVQRKWLARSVVERTLQFQ